MIKKNIEDKFTIELDAYLKGVKEYDASQAEECKELLELGKTLADKDFSKDSDKEAVFNKTLENLNKYRENNMIKKLNIIKGTGIAAASLVLVCIMGISIMQTSFAQDFAEKVRNVISLGHITIMQTETPKTETVPVPKELKGKIFDKDGKPIDVFSKESAGKMYTAEGEEIAYLTNGEIVTVSQDKKMRQEGILEIKDPKELNKYTCFQVNLPSYLPVGYKFDRAELYKDEKGLVNNSKYIGLIFTNEETGKYIYMQQRFADEETAYGMATDGKIEQVKINGIDAIISDGRSIDWEADNVLYMLSGRGEISKSELIKIAASIK